MTDTDQPAPFDAEAMAREIVAQYRVEEWTQLGDDKNQLLVGKVAAALQRQHDAHEAEAQHWVRLLATRDRFIVEEGRWTDFVKTVDRPVSGDEVEAYLREPRR